MLFLLFIRKIGMLLRGRGAEATEGDKRTSPLKFLLSIEAHFFWHPSGHLFRTLLHSFCLDERCECREEEEKAQFMMFLGVM